MLLVSPHLDDAALSCAALLARAEPLDVLTVFAGRPSPPWQGSWDAITGFPTSAESMSTRMEEERRAFAGSHHRLEALPLLELQHVLGRRPPEDAVPIREAVEHWLAGGAGTVAIPAGAGRRPGRLPARLQRMVGPPDGAEWHPDHLFVRDVVLSLVGPMADVGLIAYEELPYRWSGHPDGRVRRAARRVGRRVEPLVLPVDREAKARRIRAYASQVPHLTIDGRRVDEPANLPADERYWLLPPVRLR